MHKWLVALLLIVSNLVADTTENPAKKRMFGDIDIIANTFEVKYAPKEWKKVFSGWDLQHQVDIAKAKILSEEKISIKTFQRIVRDFLKSTSDYHVGAYFHTTEFACLPFRIQSADERFFVESVDSKSPLYPQIPLKVGDEILSFDGKPVADAIEKLRKEEFSDHNTATDRALAALLLTMRLGVIGYEVPHGPVSVEVRHKGQEEAVTYNLEWEYHPEKINKSFELFSEASVDTFDDERPISEQSFFYKMMAAPIGLALKAAKKELMSSDGDSDGDPKEESEVFGAASCFLEKHFKVLHTPYTTYFKALVFENSSGRRVGYIRIPNFLAGYYETQEFASLISTFQGMTDALVIDLTNNPGGYFFYMYALASMLTNKPLKTPTQRQTITQEEVAFALHYTTLLEEVKNSNDARYKLGSNIQGLPVDLELARNFLKHFRYIISEWDAQHYFTKPSYLYGIDKIKPHPYARYTKPLLFLINSLDFSCADFFPAIFQDNNRATLLGSKTAGAGGFVLRESYPNRFGVASYSYTGSFAQRFNNKPLENLGVTPDIEYRLTAQDLQEDFVDYKNAIDAAIEQLLKKEEKRTR